MLATCPFPTSQGTQVYIGQLASALSDRGHEVSLVTYGFGAGDIEGHDARSAYTIHRAPQAPGHTKLAAGPSWGRPVSDMLLVGKALQVLRGSDFDLIHGHNYEGALAGAILKRLTGLPFLYHAHCLMGDELGTYFDAEPMRSAGFAFGRWLDRTVPPLADLSVSVSRAAAERINEVSAGSALYLPPAVDYGDTTSQSVAEPAQAIYLGNLDGYQSVEVMLKALSRLAHTELSCAFVTNDPRAETMVAQHSLQDTVRVLPHGDFEEVKAHLEAASVALLPRTVSSGFPIKLLNYLAAGRPVVACHSGAQGLSEPEGVSVVPDGDDVAFAAALGALLEDPARARVLAERARRAFEARFCWPASAARLETIYHQLLGARTRGA